MQGHKLLHSLIQKSSLSCHQKRIGALMGAVGSLLIGKRLTLTGIARSSFGKAKERHAIRRTDRLLGNKHLHSEQKQIYYLLSSFLISKHAIPIILIDWACINKKKDWYILRASLVSKGRSHTIYQEVYPKSKLNSPGAEKPFLGNLKRILPAGIKPIIVTDAGFRCPWFKTVKSLGFHWVGRVRNKNHYRTNNNATWNYTADLHQAASNKPKFIQEAQLSKANTIKCNFVLIKKRAKGRTSKNRNGNRANDNATNRCAKREREPWLLATSLPVETAADARRIVSLYGKRMQIEEEFRDTKSHQYGFGLRYSLTNKPERIEVLLLIAVLASFTCRMIALSAQKKNLHIDYQSNSIRNRTVLSATYLACQLIRKKVSFTKVELLDSLEELKNLTTMEVI